MIGSRTLLHHNDVIHFFNSQSCKQNTNSEVKVAKLGTIDLLIMSKGFSHLVCDDVGEFTPALVNADTWTCHFLSGSAEKHSDTKICER